MKTGLEGKQQQALSHAQQHPHDRSWIDTYLAKIQLQYHYIVKQISIQDSAIPDFILEDRAPPPPIGQPMVLDGLAPESPLHGGDTTDEDAGDDGEAVDDGDDDDGDLDD